MSTEQEIHEHRQLGGYKATLHNPAASDKAKYHAAAVLADHGIDPSPDVIIINQSTTKSEEVNDHIHGAIVVEKDEGKKEVYDLRSGEVPKV